MTLDLVIPAYNESKVILPTLAFISDALGQIPDLTWKIIVAENGSTDDTYALVKNADLPGVEIFSTRQKGKGAALKEAAARSEAEYFGFTDADASPDPAAIGGMLREMRAHDIDLMTGSRFHPDTITDRGMFRHGTSRLFNVFAGLILCISVNDTQCPLKIMNKKGKALLAACEENTWFLDLELIGKAERSKLCVQTVPIIWKEFRYPLRKSKLSMMSDGSNALVKMLQLRSKLRALS